VKWLIRVLHNPASGRSLAQFFRLLRFIHHHTNPENNLTKPKTVCQTVLFNPESTV
jgi:hypothetical protein